MSRLLSLADFLNLQKGSSGPGVQKLQNWLNRALLAIPPLDESGDFDPATVNAVSRFQHAKRLISGNPVVVSLDTWRALGAKLGWPAVFQDAELPLALKNLMVGGPQLVPGDFRIVRWIFFLAYQLTFTETLTPARRGALDELLGFMEEDPNVTDLRWFAYMLATVRQECGEEWAPTAEVKVNDAWYWTPRDCPGGLKFTEDGKTQVVTRVTVCPAGQTTHTYFGRGYVQVTGVKGYAVIGDLLGVGERLLHYPTLLISDHALSYKAMSLGMREGLFSPDGRGLSHYIHDAQADYVNARRIVNSKDGGTYHSIADRALKFQRLLEASIVPKSWAAPVG